MKKVFSFLTAMLMLAGALTSCGSIEKSDRPSVVCTIFPEYDWVREIAGSHADSLDITLLLDNGVDLHSYLPTAEDMIRISSCDMFVYVGGESDAWIEDALKEAVNRDMIVIKLLDVLGDAAKEEETVEGMQGAEEGGDGPEYDEHVWLSLKNTALFCSVISEKLGEIDGKNAADYHANASAYISRLNELDSGFRQAAASSSHKTLLFGDRFPFRYLTDDYGLSYYAAFPGCSAETEASFQTIAFLAGKLDELGLGSVITLEGSDRRIAETIIQNTKKKNQKVLTLDSMQSVTHKDAENGTTYYSIMQKNLDVLKEALK